MTDGPKRRMTSPAYETRSRGYDIGSGTHGGVMPESGELPSHIVPAAERPDAGQVFPGISDPTRAYYTANFTGPAQRAPSRDANEMGWNWAVTAARGGPGNLQREVRGRSVVHTVEPEGQIDVDRNLNRGGTEGAELTADRLKVTGTEWIRPPTSNEAGVQGTLPHINWNQHVAHEGLAKMVDYNNVGISAYTGEMDISYRNDRDEEEAMDAKVHERKLKRLHATEPQFPGMEHTEKPDLTM